MINDGTHNVGSGCRRMCECCDERPAKVGFMCEVCFSPSYPLGPVTDRVSVDHVDVDDRGRRYTVTSNGVSEVVAERDLADYLLIECSVSPSSVTRRREDHPE